MEGSLTTNINILSSPTPVVAPNSSRFCPRWVRLGIGYELTWVRVGNGYELSWVRVGIGYELTWVRVGKVRVVLGTS